MKSKKTKPNIVVDVKIHFHGKTFKFTVGRVLRWLIPLTVVIVRIINYLNDNPT